MSSPLRITGMASGLDIDTMVKQLMNAEKIKVDKLTQNKQIVQWKQDMYREIIGDINTFKSTYFDVLKPDNYMLSTRNYSSFDITSTLSGAATTAVTATATSGAVAGNYSVKVVNLAEKARVQGSSAINVEQAPNKIGFPIQIGSDNDELTIGSTGGVGGTIVKIAQKVYGSLDELATEINTKMAATDVSGGGAKVGDSYKAVVKDGQIRFDKKVAINTVDPGKNNVITVTLGTSTPFDITLDTKGNYTLDELSQQISSKIAASGNNADGKYNVVMQDVSGSQQLMVQEKQTDGTYGSSTGSSIIYKGSTNITASYGEIGSEGTSTSVVSQPVIAGNKLSYQKAFIAGVNDTLTINIGGAVANTVDLKNITILSTDDDTAIINKVVAYLNGKDASNNPILPNGITAKALDGKLVFQSPGTQQVTISGNGAATLGLGSGLTIDQTIDDKMSNVLSGKSRFTINGTTFYYDFDKTTDVDSVYGKVIGAKNKSIRDIMTEISSKANVDMSYSQLTRQFTMTTKSTGADQTITAIDNGVDGTAGSKFIATLFGQTNGVNMGSTALAEKYELDISNFADGDTSYFSTAGVTPGENYTISGADSKSKAADLAAKINANTTSNYTATADENGKVTLMQKTASSTVVLSSINKGSSIGTSVNFVKNTTYTDVTATPASPASSDAPIRKGEDAQVSITEPNSTEVTINRNTNNFSVDGVNYTLNAGTGSTPVTVNLTANTQKSYDKIKAFVDKYNEIIDKINTKLYEKKQYDYKPLTDEQKKDMKDVDIKAWEEKAKQGLLANDSILGNMLNSMRSAFYEPVKSNFSDTGNIGISMADIGITTSSDISQRGKLILDETKLKDALQNKGDKVMQLFTKASTSYSSYNPNATNTERSNRRAESGVFQRISDILQDNLRTIRDNNGRKGILIEKAGIKGDYTEFHNLLTDDLISRDKIIKNMNSKLADKENAYYTQFSKLESAMQQLNSQSSWLSSQLAGMSK